MELHPYLSTLIRYGNWAHDRFFEEVDAMSEEDFLRNMGDGCGSVRDKLAHILAAERVWLDRLKGAERPRFPRNTEFPDRQTLKTEWSELRAEFSAWWSGIAPTDLPREVSYKTTKGAPYTTQVWKILAHVVNHGTYHRGQAASLIRRIRGKPPSSDLIEFFWTA